MKVKVIDLGDSVCCDLCNKDWTNDNSKAQGGFLLLSNAVCPDCAPRMRIGLAKDNEIQYIRDEQRPNETFKEACLRWRGGDNKVRIITFN